MSEPIDAYRRQIEAAGLPISDESNDSGWTTISFKYEFVLVTLSFPSDRPSYCRLEAGFSLDPVAEGDRPALIARANDNTERKRLAKTTVGFSSEGSYVKYACEFFADEDAGYAIKPSLTEYLALLGGAATTFNRNAGSEITEDDADSA